MAPPLEAVAKSLQSYAKAQSLALSNADIEDRRGFEVLRGLVVEAREALSVGTDSDIRSLLAAYLPLLQVPEAASDIAALPLPHPAQPSAEPPVPAADRACAASLLGTVYARHGPPVLAQGYGAEALTARIRSARAHARAQGGDNEDGSRPSYGMDASGVPLSSHAAMLAWSRQAELALDGACHACTALMSVGHTPTQGTGSDENGGIPAKLAADIIVTCAPFLTYAAWALPASRAAALRFLAAAAQVDVARHHHASGTADAQGTALDKRTVAHPFLDATSHAFVLQHADAVLDWCRQRSIGGAWKERGSAAVRWVTLFTSNCITFPHMNADRVARATPLAFRLADDWEVTNVWIGVSCLVHILSHALPTELRTGAAGPAQPTLVHETLARALTVRHPSLAHTLSHAVALYLLVMHGPPPPLSAGLLIDKPALSRVLRNGSVLSSPGGSTLGPFDTPGDVAIQDLLRSIALAGGMDVQYGLVTGFAPILLQLGERCARHLTALLPVFSKLTGDTIDARLACAALHALHSCVKAAPSRFTIPVNAALPTPSASTEDSGSLDPTLVDLLGRQRAVEEVIGTCVHAAMQACARLYALPQEDEEGIMAIRGEEAVPAGEQATGPSPAGTLVLSYARACLSSVEALSPTVLTQCTQQLREAAHARGLQASYMVDMALDALGMPV